MTARMTLLDHPLSPYAQKVRLLLREKGLAFDAETPAFSPNRAEGDLSAGDFNPRSEIPVLLHDGHAIYDSTIICEYIEERFPQRAMLPAAPVDRARARTIEEICDTQWEAINWGVMEVRCFGRGGSHLGPALIEAARRDIDHLYGWLGTMLGDAQWLNGSSFGWADIAALPYATSSVLLGITPAAESKVRIWLDRCMARPAVAETVGEGEAALPGMAMAAGLLETGSFRRQYRDHRLEWMIRAGGMQVVLDGLAADNVRFNDLGRFATVRG